VAIGGGTDLLVLIKEGLARPEALVDLRRIPGYRGIELKQDGSGRIGAAVAISALAGHAGVRDRWPALAEACGSVGTPALRNMGTIAGNLCQRPRCWYFRRGIDCLRNGGSRCPAADADGENQYLAIFAGGVCHVVHPSDPAVALTALDARVEIVGGGGTRTAPIGQFFADASRDHARETVLESGEMIAAIELPPESSGGAQYWRKVMQRGAWDFALVSVAAARRRDGDVRLVLGGVAGFPWRVDQSVEEDVASGGLDAGDAATLAERALYDARPLSKNAYKVHIAGSLLRSAIMEIAAP
jgi:xanthine dehydrogenase YagS FAD-binding subunit